MSKVKKLQKKEKQSQRKDKKSVDQKFWLTLNEIEAETDKWPSQTKSKLNYLFDDFAFQKEATL